MIRTFAFAAALLCSTGVYAAPAAHFLSDAIKGDNSEIRLGQIIASQGHSAAVLTFGSTLVTDHTKARAEASSTARQMGLPISSAMMPEARTELSKLQRLHGQAFDREVRRYMIQDHQKDISEFRNQVRHGDRRTAALASAQLPTLEKHLKLAELLPR